MLALNLDLVALDQLTTLLLDYALYPFITLLMCLLSVFIVLGNLLVVTAIWHENQLHSVTNYLIASLAAADCLVGALVMPFSIISEMIVGSWTFGPAWCDLWHSFDVLASTASIMNLCAISLDRYLAITNPICYPTKMTPKRVALLIVSLWTCSALISFPAILWWRAVGNGPLQLISPANVSQVVARDSSNSNRANSSSNNEISSSVSHGERVTQEQQQQRQQQQQQLQTVISSTVRPTTGYFKSIEDEQSLGASNHNNNNNNNDNVISSRLGIGENENNSREFYSHHGHQLQAINHRSTSDLNNAIQRETPPSSSSSDSDSANLVASLVTDEPIYKCVFTDDTYYLLFSSFVSFYGPLCVMLYAYICIYKAAVQQTRFLKHGSKQVMIGGSGNGGSGGGSDGTGSGKKNKKNRRYRNASEHSHQSGADRGMDPSASCDGSCDNFERQHLVLRAHRGGGGGSVAVSKQTSKSSTSAGGDSPTAARPATGSFQHPSNKHLRSGAQFKSRHKNMREANAASEQQACLTEDDGDDEDEDESELDSGNQTTNHLESLGQQHHHNNQTNVSQSSGSFHGSSSGGVGSFRPRTSSPSRSHRINLTLSKRDRMRVESQRFTASNAISIELNDENKNNNKLKPLTPNERDAIEPSSPAATTCWRKLQPRSALGIDQNHSSSNHHHHQKQCDSLEDNQTSQDSTIQFGADPQLAASDELMRRSDSANSGGRSGGVGFRFVNALRRGDSRATPPLPASLVPLIMMNSDTSTDSSIVTVVTRPTAPMLQRSSTVEHSSSNNKNTPAAAAATTTTTTTTPATAKHADGKVGDKLSELNNSDVEHYVLNLTTSPTVEPCSGRDGNSDSGSIRSSVELTPETKHTSGTRRPNQVTINLSFDDSAESRSKRASGLSGVRPENSTTSGASATSKGQILHYDSDKLIQSIVDLTNIHYIDCAVTSNQTPVSTNRVAVCEGSGVGGGSGAKFANSTTMPIEVADVVVVPPALEIGTKTQTTKGILSKTSSNSVGSAGGGGPQADSHHQLVGQMVTVELNQNNQNHYTTTTTTTTTTSGGDTSSTNANRMLPPPNGASSMGVTRVVRTKQPSITTTISTPTLTTRPEVLPPPPPITTAVVLAVAAATNNTATTTNGSPTQNVPRQQKSMGRKLTKLAKERKAAKTLGIVVGVFILCWLPFFVVNILVALCGTKCIYKPHILNSVVTWLGWLNSAMNPVIYACWSRDFRRAFRRVLCTWVEFVCYDGTRLAQKLKLKKSSGYSTNAYEVHSTSRPASSTQRSGASIEANAIAGSGGGGGGGNGGVVVVGVPTSAIGGAGGFCG